MARAAATFTLENLVNMHSRHCICPPRRLL